MGGTSPRRARLLSIRIRRGCASATTCFGQILGAERSGGPVIVTRKPNPEGIFSSSSLAPFPERWCRWLGILAGGRRRRKDVGGAGKDYWPGFALFPLMLVELREVDRIDEASISPRYLGSSEGLRLQISARDHSSRN